MPSMPPSARVSLSGIETHNYNQENLCHYLSLKKKEKKHTSKPYSYLRPKDHTDWASSLPR